MAEKSRERSLIHRLRRIQKFDEALRTGYTIRMTLGPFKIILAFIVLFAAIIGGLWPFLKKARRLKNEDLELDFPIGESFASGVFLGAGLLHMLPDATRDFSKAGFDYPISFLIAGSGFLLLLLLEHIGVSLKHRSSHWLSSIALLTVGMLSIHSLLEGAAIGFATTYASVIIIFLAIIAHKSAAAFALSINLNRSQLHFSSRFILFSVFALMTPFGIFAGDWILSDTQHNVLLTPIFISLAAGTFLYIGTLHGLERASLIRHCCNMKEFFFMLSGFIIMAILAIWV